MRFRGAVVLAFLTLIPATALAATFGLITADTWRTSCAPGSDEFVSNCTSTAQTAGLEFEIATVDSQLFLMIGPIKPCRKPAGAQTQFWRDEMIGLGATTRRRKVAAWYQRAGAGVRALCMAKTPIRLVFESIPDLAVKGAPRR